MVHTLLYYPNLIGYVRVLVTVWAFSLYESHPDWMAWLYLLGQGLDAIDGPVARHFNQCSRFGAALDMLTDRLSTATLLLVLSLAHPSSWSWFAAVLALDVSSHWMAMLAAAGAGAATHKPSASAATTRSPSVTESILVLYYREPWLTLLCAGHELFLLSLLLAQEADAGSAWIVRSVGARCWLLFLLKQACHAAQLAGAVSKLLP